MVVRQRRVRQRRRGVKGQTRAWDIWVKNEMNKMQMSKKHNQLSQETSRGTFLIILSISQRELSVRHIYTKIKSKLPKKKNTFLEVKGLLTGAVSASCSRRWVCAHLARQSRVCRLPNGAQTADRHHAQGWIITSAVSECKCYWQ